MAWRKLWWTMPVTALLVALLGVSPSDAAEDQYVRQPRYTFSWPLHEGAPPPRGGTTKGAPVTLDTAESREWRALQTPDISSFERDRRAILAMAGTYRVTFDFLEVVSFDTAQERPAPYQSWGTEKIYVDSDSGRAISLVHILEMHMLQPDGSIARPIIVKHWRQDWRYQPRHIVEYRGRERWQRRRVAPADARRAWSQTVYQVDESPRYASIGRWQHSDSFSSWLSGETWRPLPRREWSVRDDYHVLVGVNRHSVFANGWTQEENNLKAVLTPARELRAQRPYLAREYGLARYERIKDADFAGADEYYEATRKFWNGVRDTWAETIARQGAVTLRGPVDKLGLFKPLFAHADAIAAGSGGAGDHDDLVIRAALREMGALE